MKQFALSIMLFFASFALNAQNVKGYYITTSGQRTEGYFKSVNFYNENNLLFTSAETGTDYAKVDPETVSEYGAGDDVVFKKFTVQLDDSKLMGTDVGPEKMPVWVTKTVFMNLIIDGDASLYSYTSDKGVKYFFDVKSKNIALNQLVYKQYMAKQNAIGENSQFRQQLYNSVSCPGDNVSAYSSLNYSKKEIQNVFRKYNSCTGSGKETKELEATASRKSKFTFTLLAGAGSTKVETGNIDPVPGSTTNTLFTGGAEMALTLPSGMFSFFFKAMYEDVSAETQITTTTPTRTSVDTHTIKSSFADLYIGPRYNFNFAGKHTLFADVAYAVAIPFGDTSRKHQTTTVDGTVSYYHEYTLKSDFFYTAGVGYQYNNKYGVEVHSDFSREYDGVDLTTVKLNRLWVNLRYTF
ncbi:hypothetical protein ACLI1A_14280 [Flavobacterium sp. RHBU_3]|uniref:hypothetical protein n=1 Tax=Flavobacterium sp. RHBU_3 TaxID=3391184 RepID=UPI0039851F44